MADGSMLNAVRFSVSGIVVGLAGGVASEFLANQAMRVVNPHSVDEVGSEDLASVMVELVVRAGTTGLGIYAADRALVAIQGGALDPTEGLLVTIGLLAGQPTFSRAMDRFAVDLHAVLDSFLG